MKEFSLSNSEVFSILFDGISEGALIVNTQQQILELNSSAANMFGYDIEELKYEHIDKLIPKEFHHIHHTHVKSFIKKDEKRQMGENRKIYGLKKSGDTFPIEAGLNPFEVDGKKFIMTIITDITKRVENEKQILALNESLERKVQKRTEELQHSVNELSELNDLFKDEIIRRKEAEARIKTALQKEKELNELKTKFLSLVSHEFKTPLSGILTSTTLATKYTKTEQQDKREKHLNTIKNKVHYLTSILNDFLSIERLESGKVTYKFEYFSLLNLINEVVYNSNVTLKSGQIIKYPQDLDEVELYQDRNVLELILTNLMNNAIKYSKEDTTITLDVEKDEACLLFKVSDEGIGIPAKDQEHIFERYFRAENALLNQGTGIGLNIIKVHLENLGGHISFESEENKGSIFLFKLPIKHSD